MAKRKTAAVKMKAAEVNQVAKWIITGAAVDDVTEAIRAASFEGAPAALMLAAMARFRDAANFEPSILLGFVLEGVREVYRKCVESGDYATALRALKQLEGMAKYVRQQEDSDPQQTTPVVDDTDDAEDEIDAGADDAAALAGPA